MKLRNKKTGKIVCARFCGITYIDDDDHLLKMWLRDDDNEYEYNSLTELNEDWVDYEEPKEDYIRVITSFINYVEEADDSFACDESVKKFVEKLKAWKRLRDKRLVSS